MSALIAFVLGVAALQLQSDLPGTTLLGMISAAGAVIGISSRFVRDRRGATLLLACSGVACGFGYAGLRAVERMADQLASVDEGQRITIIGVVASLPAKVERGVRFEFDVERVDGTDHVPARVMLAWYAAPEPVRAGERWRLTVRLRRPHGLMNPAGFDAEAWLLERDIRSTGYVETARDAVRPQRLQSMVWRPSYAIERVRGWLRDRLLDHTAGERFGGVLLALVIGDQRAISSADWTLFNRTGISHLVSISGLHITMIAALVAGLVGAIWRRSPRLLTRLPVQTAAVLSGAVAAVFYALLAGWGIPAQRTVLMLACVGVAWMRRSVLTPGRALVVAAALVCLMDPWAVIAPGFWLSFGAVAAIVWVVQGRPVSGEKPRWRSVLAIAARVQLAVTLALIPATVFVFQQVSLISPLANAIAIPLVSWVTTPLALVAAVFAAMPAPLDSVASLLLTAANASFGVLDVVLTALAALPSSAIAVGATPLPLVVLAAVGVAWILAPPGWPARYLGVVALLPLFVWPVERPAAGEVWVTALDVGQGSSIVIESRDRTWLYDTGPRYSSESDAGMRVVVPYLRWRGVERLDGVVVSHLDVDHSGGAASIIAAMPVARLLTSIAPGHPSVAGAVGLRSTCAAGQRIDDGDLVIHVLHPESGDYTAKRPTNSMSCVIRVDAQGVRMLLTGDIPAIDEQAIVDRAPDIASTWILVPHHGSRSSSSEALLAAARPRWAAVQSGYRNRFRHPDEGVIDRYRRYGASVERTDRSGALQWRFSRDATPNLLRWRTEAVRYWHDRAPSSPESWEGRPADAEGDDPIIVDPPPPELMIGN